MWNRSSKKSSKEKFASAQEAYNCALNLLSYRDFSDKKMKERLQLKGADEEQAEQAIAKLQHYGLLDEQRYAARVFEGWLNKRSYGRQHLRAELVKRGIRPELVQEMLGHSDVRTTLALYAHVLPGRDRDAAERAARIRAQMACVRDVSAGVPGDGGKAQEGEGIACIPANNN